MSHISGNFLIQKKFPAVIPATRSVRPLYLLPEILICLLFLGIILITKLYTILRTANFCFEGVIYKIFFLFFYIILCLVIK